MRRIKNLIRSLVGLRNETDFYSQAGEDAIVSNVFNYVVPKTNGFYIDIGAYDPFKHSNTYLLYKAGWRGVNIDPRPGSKKLFDRHRPDDINIQAGVAMHEGTLTYHVVAEDSTMNSLSRENLERIGMFDKVKRTVEVPVRTLNSIFNDHPEIKSVDYLNIDAEGYEKEIISGLDTCAVKPTVVSLEQNGTFTFSDVLRSDTYELMARRGYVPIAKNVILRDVATVFYVHEESLSASSM